MIIEKSKKSIPSLDNAIKGAKSVPECVLNQIKILNKENDLDYRIFSNRLKNYYQYITDRELLKSQREHFNAFYDEIDKTYPSLLFRIEGRRKSFTSAYKKLWFSPPDVILKDIAAFRVTLFGDESGYNPEKLTDICYTIAEHLVQYSIRCGFIPCPAEALKNTEEFVLSNHPHVILPKKSLLSDNIKGYVKDYILHPKADEYQSLHIVFMDENQHYFEVQIRTLFMHIAAEDGPASHEVYKQRYERLDIDRKAISIPGYSYFLNAEGEEKIYDWVGFEESLEILRRQKTY